MPTFLLGPSTNTPNCYLRFPLSCGKFWMPRTVNIKWIRVILDSNGVYIISGVKGEVLVAQS